MIPNYFMIVGAPKCGTTSLVNWLDQHPDIKMSYPKEPKFLACEYPLGIKYYVNEYFRGAYNLNKFNGEANVYNMLYKFAPDRIEQMFGKETKIIMCVRNPVDRFISEWANWHFMRPGRFPWSLEETFTRGVANFDLDFFDCEEKVCGSRDVKGGSYNHRMLEAGCYGYYSNRFAERFPTYIAHSEMMLRNPAIIFNDILSFLGADSYDPIYNTCNKTKHNFILQEEVVESIKDFYHNFPLRVIV